MTIERALESTRDLTGAVVSRGTMVRWLSELDGKLAFETFRKTEWDAYDGDGDTELLIPYPWDGLYVHYLEAMTYYANGEYDRYTNSMTMYDSVLEDYLAWRRRSGKRGS